MVGREIVNEVIPPEEEDCLEYLPVPDSVESVGEIPVNRYKPPYEAL
jgi:hypothetical protein